MRLVSTDLVTVDLDTLVTVVVGLFKNSLGQLGGIHCPVCVLVVLGSYSYARVLDLGYGETVFLGCNVTVV